MEPMYISTATLLHLTLLWIALTKGEIRCYCNAPTCVGTGYMCKSEEGRCYSLLTYEDDRSKSAHGCIDILPMKDRSLCGGSGDIIKARNGQQEWPVLMCCQDDMCNYIDNLDINVDIEVKTENSSTKVLADVKNDYPLQHKNHDTPINHQGYSSERELWFKAAVIAVPIAGGFILILLVLLAVRMLRQDNKRHHRLIQMRNHRSLAKAQLYVTDHFYVGKKGKKTQLQGHLNTAAEKAGHVCYNDVNIKIQNSPSSYVTLADKKARDGSNGCSHTRDSVLIMNGTKTETLLNSSSVV